MAVLNTFINFIKVYNMESKHRVKKSKHLVEMTKSISTLGKVPFLLILIRQKFGVKISTLEANNQDKGRIGARIEIIMTKYIKSYDGDFIY
ncbi:hypothetical protein S245_030279 [Arachis hypogaea]